MKFKLGKRETFIAIVVIAIVVIGNALRPGMEGMWSRFRDFTDPFGYYDKVEKRWANKSTDFLIGKLGHPSVIYDGVAGSTLARRKDLRRVPKLEKIIKSDENTERRSSALGVLFAWDENKAIDLSMEIIRAGRDHPLYMDALRHLAHRRYDPAYPYVLELAKEPDPFSTGSIQMLEKFGKLDAIPVLEKALERVRKNDKIVERLDRSSILDAIQSIKEKNRIVDQQVT